MRELGVSKYFYIPYLVKFSEFETRDGLVYKGCVLRTVRFQYVKDMIQCFIISL